MANVKFDYDLDIPVYFWKEGKAYKGTIVRRAYVETHFPAQEGIREKPQIGTGTIYVVLNQALGEVEFNERSFNFEIFTNKSSLVEKFLFIK